jgi:hypothetical protein
MKVLQTSVVVKLILLSTALASGQVSHLQAEPILQKVSLSLDNETVFDGLAKLNAITKLGFSVERELTSREAPALAATLRFNSSIDNVTVREALDWLCKLDPRYSWSADGSMINFYPASIEHDPNYPLNRSVAPFVLHQEQSATAAVGAATSHADPPQQIAVFQFGPDQFGAPTDLSFRSMTLRQALNQIAEAQGQSHGWQFTGTKEFHCIAFHERLLVGSSADPPKK